MTALSAIARIIVSNPIARLYRHYIIDSIVIVKKSGFKELLRRRGWKFFAIIVAYYTVRDTILYIILPFCVARGLF